ncbi:hypothetical protein GWI33_013539 [Rhynchophorus ferrugineus]|uniref:protein acetyllysine N-acetyltransferase n=1 Tax=Rhynchophorus ferrugineus TaxID=354439 RepID=A0A834I6B1_RHYFE|nr:hypothetical protein GWI33_013539 [Rhynchophorus ferrugineus]
MDSYPDVQEYESSAKRIKIDFGETNVSELCNSNGFSCFSTSTTGPIDITEGIGTDCDSGYEASTMESLPTPSHHTSPHTDAGDLQVDTPQESLDVEDDDDNTSTVSHLSELSGLSDLSGQDWKPMASNIVWIQQQIQKGVNPRDVLTGLGVDLDHIPRYMDDGTLWKIVINMLAEPPKRNKLRHVNTLDDVVRLLKGAQKIIVLTGAGVSVSCGIPDFRSRDGIYSRLAIDFPNLPDPQAMFDISFFSQDPRPFFKFARDIYPGKFKPSPCHRFIKLLEKHHKLLRNYTQNIDTLEKEAEIERVIECHGSFATATCTKCEHKVNADKIRDIVLAQKIPLCEKCHLNAANSASTDDFGCEGTDYKDLVLSGIMKPDIVFFVIGSSLKVRPVALIPSSLPANVPQILINREPLPHCHFDIELLGDCDAIINHICRLLGQNWEEGVYTSEVLTEVTELLPYTEDVTFDINKWRDSGTSLSSSSLKDNCLEDTDEVSRCTCEFSITSNTTINNPGSSQNEITCTCNIKGKLIKERHISIDSARDSGIGENSNFTDIETESKEGTSFNLDLSANDPSCGLKKTDTTTCFDDKSQDMRGFWQPKVKKSIYSQAQSSTMIPTRNLHSTMKNRTQKAYLIVARRAI